MSVAAPNLWNTCPKRYCVVSVKGEAATLAFELSEIYSELGIGILVAGNAGRPGGNLGGTTNWPIDPSKIQRHQVKANHTTAEEDIYSNHLIAQSGLNPDEKDAYDKYDAIFKSELAGRYGMKHPNPPIACKYGQNCRQKNPSHFQTYSHPKKECRYGANCFQKNLAHRQQFSHPPIACTYGANCFQKNLAHRQQYSHPWRTKGQPGNYFDRETIQSVNFGDTLRPEAYQRVLAVVQNAKLHPKMYSPQAAFDQRNVVNVTLGWGAGPNASGQKLSGKQAWGSGWSSMARTYDESASKDWTTFREGVRAAIEGGLDAMIRAGVKIAIIPGISTGVYAGPWKKEINTIFDDLVLEAAAQPAFFNPQNASRCEYLDMIFSLKFSREGKSCRIWGT